MATYITISLFHTVVRAMRRGGESRYGTYLGLLCYRSSLHAWGPQAWIAVIEWGAASVTKFSKAYKVWAKERSPSVRARRNLCARTRFLRRSKKASLAAIAKVVFGRPSSTSFGLNRASGRQPS